MSRQLHPYQEDAVREIPKRLAEHGRVVAVGPTGSGKTVIGAAVVRNLGARAPVTWLAHRHELLVQARDELIACGVPADDVGILTGQLVHNPNARILCATVGKKPTRDASLIVVDEAHHIVTASYMKAIANAPHVLGLTATPERLDGKPLGDVFNDLFVMAEVEALGAQGYITIPDCYGLSRQEARALVRGASARGHEYNLSALERNVTSHTLMGNVVSECRRLASGERTIVCAVRREHGRELASRFAADGRPTEYLDGNTPVSVRKAMIGKGGRFESGETEVVVHVDVLGEGIDIPAVQCVALCRPTKSLTLFLQQVGRASRVHEGKTPIILDHAGNCHRFGLPDEKRDWSLEGRDTSQNGEAPEVKHCAACDKMNRANATHCAQCGSPLPATRREEKAIEEHAAVLRRLGKRSKREAFEKLAQMRGLPNSWVEAQCQ